MGTGRRIKSLSGTHKNDRQHPSFIIPPLDSSFEFQATSSSREISNDNHSRFCKEDEDIDEYFGRLSPFDKEVQSPSRSNSKTQPDVGFRFGASPQSQSSQFCDQLGLQMSGNQTASGRRLHAKKNQGFNLASSITTRDAKTVARPGSRRGLETGSPEGEVEEKAKLTYCQRCSPPRTRPDSPVLQWIIARLEDWQHHLNHLPVAGTASRHLQNVATALTQLEEEVKLIRGNLNGHTVPAEAELAAGVSFVEEDSRVVARTFIVHVRSNTFMLSFQQLCYYMKELPGWTLRNVPHGSVIFSHYEHDAEGFYTEKPNACATLPDQHITQLRRRDAKKFVDSVNGAEGEIVFCVQTVFVREKSNDRPDSE